MKLKLPISIIAAFVTSMAIAQTPCDAGRYSSDVFPNVTVTSGVAFGSNDNFLGSNVNLAMDIYEPTGDTELKRPLIIWAHGGSFIAGTRTDSDVTTLADAFAKKGYVCASIDYRTGMWPVDSVNAVQAVLRAVQDMKGATRFFYEDADNADTYKIDTTRIFIGGSSAGAVTALHMAYLDKQCEIESYLDPSTVSTMGGIEGTSGSVGYSSDVAGVINLCGALASYAWLENGDVPFCSLHGTDDGTVPYNRGVASVSGFNVITMDGSRMLYEQANAMSVSNNFYSHYNAGHAVYAGSSAYMDTTINFVRDFLIEQLGCTEPALQAANAPLETSTLYQVFYCGLGTEENTNSVNSNIYPNPSDDMIAIELENTDGLEVIVTDLLGRKKATYTGTSSVVLTKDELGAGQFILQIFTLDGKQSIEKIQFN